MTDTLTRKKRIIIEKFMGHPPNLYHYAFDWNDIMGVVEKIRGLSVIEGSGTYGVLIDKQYTQIYEDNENNAPVLDVQDPSFTTLYCVFEACYEFIEYYNKIMNLK